MQRHSERHFWFSVARGCGGAIIFSFPLLMTMEMWWLGFTMTPARLLLLVVLTTPLLALVSYYSGFDRHHNLLESVLDAFVAWVIGLAIAFAMLAVFGILTVDMPIREVAGKCLIQAVPASIGAVLARSLLGGSEDTEHRRRPGNAPWSELALRAIGALLLGFTAAPTEEMVLISYRMSKWQTIILMLVAMVMLQAFIYAAEHRGQPRGQRMPSQGKILFWRAVPAYAVAMIVSGYVLWSFGRLDGMAPAEAVQATVVLSFPATLGAGAVRLLL